MPRTVPHDRVARLIDAATGTFVARGYRLTQMADVAEALGLAKGTLYGYVESKEALFDAVLRFADGSTPLPNADALPLRTPSPGATVAYLRDRLRDETTALEVGRVLRGERRIADAAEELEVVLVDLFRRIARHRRALKLVDRCAPDLPELAALWFESGRFAQHGLLVELIRRRGRRGKLRRVEHPELLARTLLESVAFWAMHRHFDPAPQVVEDSDAERMLVDLAWSALLPRSR